MSRERTLLVFLPKIGASNLPGCRLRKLFHELEVAVLVEGAGVPGEQPAVLDLPGRLVGLVPVPLETDRVPIVADPDIADPVRFVDRLCGVGVEDAVSCPGAALPTCRSAPSGSQPPQACSPPSGRTPRGCPRRRTSPVNDLLPERLAAARASPDATHVVLSCRLVGPDHHLERGWGIQRQSSFFNLA